MKHPFVAIAGHRRSGKSVLVRQYVDDLLKKYPTVSVHVVGASSISHVWPDAWRASLETLEQEILHRKAFATMSVEERQRFQTPPPTIIVFDDQQYLPAYFEDLVANAANYRIFLFAAYQNFLQFTPETRARMHELLLTRSGSDDAQAVAHHYQLDGAELEHFRKLVHDYHFTQHAVRLTRDQRDVHIDIYNVWPGSPSPSIQSAPLQ